VFVHVTPKLVELARDALVPLIVTPRSDTVYRLAMLVSSATTMSTRVAGEFHERALRRGRRTSVR